MQLFSLCTPQEGDPSGRAIEGLGLRPLAFWDCGFESRWRYGCLSVVSLVCCQVKVTLPSVVYLIIIVKPDPLGLSSQPKKQLQRVEGNTRDLISYIAPRLPDMT